MNYWWKCKTSNDEDIVCSIGNNGFNDNHSIGYCMIGYLCAYLRYYHPYEFITAYLNNANGEDDVKSGNDLASLYGIRIVPPRFGISKDKYLFNKNEKVIAKGIASVKYMNGNVANELFNLAATGKPSHFMDLLKKVTNETSLDTRQREILVKIDYFCEYGNSKELLKMLDFFAFFKNGAMKKISKDKLNPQMESLIAPYATDKSKSGQAAKSYTITDMDGLLLRCEELVKSMQIQDFDYKVKMQTQLENLGYIDLTTNRQEDRRKLIITDVFPLSSKTKNQIWGYALITRSIGSGKTSRLTVRSRLYDKAPIRRYDTIYASEVNRDQSGYWYLLSYKHLT